MSKECWKCHASFMSPLIFCPHCTAIQPSFPQTPFERLGISPAFTLDLIALDKIYFKLQQDLHPDRFVTKSHEEKSFSQAHTIALNEAYKCLKSLLRRAEFLLKEAGISDLSTLQNPELLMESMELREKLGTFQSLEDIASFEEKIKNQLKALENDIEDAFLNKKFSKAHLIFLRMTYYQKLIQEIRLKRISISHL
jgi:molecular chaperone HscB